MKVDTITGQTFKLTKKGTTTKIAAAVSYKAVITTGARDAAGNPLAQQYRWFFTVG